MWHARAIARSFADVPGRRRAAIAAALLSALVLGLSACGDDGDERAEPAGQAPTTQAEPAPAELDKVADTAETAKAASATEVPADELQSQIDAVEQGLEDGGFDASNVGTVGDAKANFVIDTSWAVYVYGSDRAAAELALSLKDIRTDEADFALFRIGNRVYYASMTSALSAEDRAKLDEIAEAVEGAITAR